MAVTVVCPHCGAKLKYNGQQAITRRPCVKCGGQVEFAAPAVSASLQRGDAPQPLGIATPAPHPAQAESGEAPRSAALHALPIKQAAAQPPKDVEKPVAGGAQPALPKTGGPTTVKRSWLPIALAAATGGVALVALLSVLVCAGVSFLLLGRDAPVSPSGATAGSRGAIPESPLISGADDPSSSGWPGSASTQELPIEPATGFYEEPQPAYDADWQLGLPEHVLEAIRETRDQ